MISLKATLEAIKTKLNAHDKALSVDYIVEQGTSGIWTYRKWNSGIAECWGQAVYTITGWSSWISGLYYSTVRTNYPFDFKTTPTAQVTGGNDWNIVIYTGATTSSITTTWAADKKTSRTIKANIYIKGTYK